jgi:hypothetical protein
MIIEKITVPCPHCMAELERELAQVKSGQLRAVYCAERGVSLSALVNAGEVVWWQLWPCESAEHQALMLSTTEAVLTLTAVGDAANSTRH